MCINNNWTLRNQVTIVYYAQPGATWKRREGGFGWTKPSHTVPEIHFTITWPMFPSQLKSTKLARYHVSFCFVLFSLCADTSCFACRKTDVGNTLPNFANCARWYHEYGKQEATKEKQQTMILTNWPFRAKLL